MEQNSRLSDKELSEIRYHVIYNNDDLSSEALALKDKIFSYWKKSWEGIYLQLKTNETLDINDFKNCSRITYLSHGDQIIGLHIHTDYQEHQFKTENYFKLFNQECLEQLKNKKVKIVQALKYLWVDPAWSKKKTGVNFAAIISSLSMNFQKQEHLDATTAVARIDVKVDEIAHNLGFEKLSNPAIMHNVPVSLMACFVPQKYPDIQVVKWANYYWKNKFEFKKQTLKKRMAA